MDSENKTLCKPICKTGDIMGKILVNTEDFNGRYVAMKNFDDKTIVGVGDDPEMALRDAESKGHENAVILYVPEKDTVHIYLLDSKGFSGIEHVHT